MSTWHDGHLRVKITEESSFVEIKLKPSSAYCSVVIRVKTVYRAQRLVIQKHSRQAFCFRVSLSHGSVKTVTKENPLRCGYVFIDMVNYPASKMFWPRIDPP